MESEQGGRIRYRPGLLALTAASIMFYTLTVLSVLGLQYDPSQDPNFPIDLLP
jgi:hypothetical protein